MTTKSLYEHKKSFLHEAMRPKSPTARAPRRSLSEFAAEIGVSVRWLTGQKAICADFPVTEFQSGNTGYYVHAQLKAWYAKHRAAK